MVDISGGLKERLNESLKRAQKLYSEGQADMAADEYERCARIMKELIPSAVSQEVQKTRLEKAKQYLELARKIRSGEAVAVTPDERAAASRQKKESKASQSSPEAEKDDFSGEITGLIQKSTVSWEQIGGLEQTKSEIRAAFAIATAALPHGVKLKTSRNLLLYGPPGTGKTLLAAAASRGLSATFFNIKVSSLLSKYFGESSKLVSALFSEARNRAPSVIFFDEVDALTPSRSGNVDGAEKRLLSTLLSELDGLESKNSVQFLYVMGATNAPWDMDEAILSRFGKMVYVPLPDEAARGAILNIHLAKNGLSCDISMAELVELTEGYSGRDIEQLCGEASQIMIMSANPDLSQMSSGKGKQLVIRPIAQSEMLEAMKHIRPKTDRVGAEKYDKWLNDRE